MWPRLRGHQSKLLYDWTTHVVNLAKGIVDMKDREIHSKCRLCNMNDIETQVHTSTTYMHYDLLLIRNIYKKEIDEEISKFRAVKLKASETWVIKIVNFMVANIWSNTELTSDLWNGRWTRHMWTDVLGSDAGNAIRFNDFTAFRLWMKRITSKLFRLNQPSREKDLNL
jgi:hypothetical protein